MLILTNFKRAVYTLALVFSLLTICAANSLEAADLHLIMVGDLDAQDLKEAVRLDLKNVRQEAEKISTNTSLKVKEVVFSGVRARTPRVLEHLRSMQVNKEDVVIFYFSGHGYRTPSKGDNPWPNLYFTTENLGIDLKTILEVLEQKSAHLIISVTDCCNSVLPDSYAPPLTKEMAMHGWGSNDLTKANYRKLFIESNGFIAISSSEAGQTSLCTTKGSFYTISFIESIAREVKNPTDIVNWQSILDNASYKVSTLAQQYDDEQDPIFMLIPH